MKTNPPILPRSKTDPVGTNDIELAAMRDFRSRFKKISKAYQNALSIIPTSPVVNKKYEYRIDRALMQSVLDGAANVVSQQLLEGDKESVWFFSAYVAKAYQRGTAQEFANLSRQSPAYQAGQMSMQNILMSDPYRRRIGLIAAREFEQMEGLVGDTKARMSRVLADGIARGRNPKDVAKSLSAEADAITRQRANTIARTEIGGALRNARLDETEDAENRYGLLTMEMHLSALSPTSRESHIVIHGKLRTRDEVRGWYSEGGNAINCKCNEIAVLVYPSGEPIVQSTVDRAVKQRKEYLAKNDA